ncbi:MAG: metallophosphoesterase family protein [Candidatus Kapaibacterium sp.]
MNSRVFIIGDIHGCNKTFNSLLYDNLRVNTEDKIYLLGDYIDRGPDSCGVVDTILNLQANGYELECLIGNHEQMLLDSLNSIEDFQLWMQNGAVNTLKSFGIEYIQSLPMKYVNFFKNLNFFIELDNYILVHGGLNFSIDDPLQDKSSMVWKRNTTVEKEKIGGKRIIVGHTPVDKNTVIESLNTDRIMLDAGCVYHGFYRNLGYLAALELNTGELFFKENVDF